MKILMINKFLYPNGGSETYIFEIGKQLEQMGHEVQYFGMEHPERIVGNHAESYTSGMDFHSGGLKKLIYPFKIIYSREARRKLRRVIQDFQPDVIHLNNFNFQLTPSIIYEASKYAKKRKKHIPLVYTAHDYQWICPNHMMKIPADGRLCSRCIGGHFFECSKYKCIHGSGIRSILGTVEAELYKRLNTYKKVDTVICPSRFMQKMLSTNPLLSDKTVVMHNFINKAQDLSDTDAGQNPKGSYVLYMGRYDKEKGIETLLRVCSELEDIPFVFAGKGALETEVDRAPNIDNRGFVTGAELADIIINARFLVFPSEWYENCPFSVMEAQMYGTPVLASDIGGTPELIKEHVTGELFEAGNRGELKEKILKLWNQPEICKEYSVNCRETGFDTVEAYCEKLMKVYDSKR